MIENSFTHYITIFTFLISVICVAAVLVMIGIAIFDRRHIKAVEEKNGRKELLKGIKIVVRDLNKLNPSIKGQDVLISDLCFLLPSYRMEDILSALQDFEDVKSVDVENGLIYFPQHTFEC